MTISMHRPEASAAEQDAQVWARLAAPVPTSAIAWRQDGRVVQRDGRYLARFVCYIEANTVRARLDSVVPGEWSLTLEPLPPLTTVGGDGEANEAPIAFKARLQILGVVREDVGCGRDYKSASTDAFKRVAVRFGIGHELYDYEQNWVQVDGDGRYPKPLEDPQVAYERRMARKAQLERENGSVARPAASQASSEAPRESAEPADGGEAQPGEKPRPLIAGDVPPCPKCGSKMWDNRIGKRNPKAPDFKCRDRSCDGVIWPAKQEKGPQGKQPISHGGPIAGLDEEADDVPPRDEDDDLPF